VLDDLSIGKSNGADAGIACQSMLLGAAEKGLGGCMFGAVDRKRLAESLRLPDNYEINLVVALGKPKEEVVLDDMKDGDYKYWRDGNRVHHIPKRALEEIIIN
jgi:nitroreductase